MTLRYRDGHCPECGYVKHKPGCAEAIQATVDEVTEGSMAYEIDTLAVREYERTPGAAWGGAIAMLHPHMYAAVRRGHAGPLFYESSIGRIEIRCSASSAYMLRLIPLHAQDLGS